MIGRIIEIFNPGIHLSLDRGFMRVNSETIEKSMIPISDIASLVLSGLGVSITTNLLKTLQENGCIVILTGDNYHPSNLLWPIAGHHQHHERIHHQIKTKVPIKKRIWQAIVKKKIFHQGAVLDFYTANNQGLFNMVEKVRSGDPDNYEAQAARRYWKGIMGDDFKRDPTLNDINGLLNYGYSIIRACMARAVSATGMHPALGIHHHNKNNAFCLIDDLVEVFRPLIDFNVCILRNSGNTVVSKETKHFLVNTLFQDLKTDQGKSTVSACILRLAQTFYNSIESGKIMLEFPTDIIPITNINKI